MYSSTAVIDKCGLFSSVNAEPNAHPWKNPPRCLPGTPLELFLAPVIVLPQGPGRKPHGKPAYPRLSRSVLFWRASLTDTGMQVRLDQGIICVITIDYRGHTVHSSRPNNNRCSVSTERCSFQSSENSVSLVVTPDIRPALAVHRAWFLLLSSPRIGTSAIPSTLK